MIIRISEWNDEKGEFEQNEIHAIQEWEAVYLWERRLVLRQLDFGADGSITLTVAKEE